MSSIFLTDLPPQSIRDAVIEMIKSFNTPLAPDEIITHIFDILDINDTPTEENIKYINQILNDMVSSKRLTLKNEKYDVGDLKKTNEDDVYQITHIKSPSSNMIKISGHNTINTIGSQYYVEAWSKIKPTETIEVEIIPELNNPYDSNAVAVTHNDELLGHFTRTNAAEYSSYIQEINHIGYTIKIDATVESDPKNPDYKFLKISAPKPEELKQYL